MRAYISRFAQLSSNRARTFPSAIISMQLFGIAPVKRSYGSSSGHDDHHEAAPARHPYPKENWNKLWIVGSAAIFFPVIWSLLDEQKKNAAVKQKSALLIHEEDSEEKDKEVIMVPTQTPDAQTESASEASEISNSVAETSSASYKVSYVLVGAGTASYQAMKAIKEQDPKADILIIGDEPYIPYQRPPLSKELWRSTNAEELTFKDFQGNQSSLFYDDKDAYEIVDVKNLQALNEPSEKVRFLGSIKVKSLDPESSILTLENGQRIEYKQILLATGGTPKKLPFVKSLPENAQKRVLTFRSLDDFKKLDKLQATGNQTIAIVGGGFLGSELAVALAQKAKENGNKIIQVFPEDGNMALVFPHYLTKWTTSKLEEEGVEVKPGSHLASMAQEEEKVVLNLKEGESIKADYVLLAVGISPNVDIAKMSGLELDEKRGGVIVNAELEARSNVFAAGDCVSYHDIALGRRRVEHYDHAAMSGRVAGLNMTGAKSPYTYQSMFWSDLGPKIGYEAVGILDSSLTTVGVWAKDKNHPRTAPDERSEYQKGIVYYLNKDSKIVGILLFNTFGKVDLARNILKQGKIYKEPSQLQNLINIYQEYDQSTLLGH